MTRATGRTNCDWLTPNDIGWEHATIEVLMDIRGELRRLNELLHCSNAVQIPHILRTIAANTKKPRKRRRAKP